MNKKNLIPTLQIEVFHLSLMLNIPASDSGDQNPLKKTGRNRKAK